MARANATSNLSVLTHIFTHDPTQTAVARNCQILPWKDETWAKSEIDPRAQNPKIDPRAKL